MGAYLSLSGSGREVGWGWVLIRGLALIKFFCLQDGHLFEVGANSRLGAYWNKYGNPILPQARIHTGFPQIYGNRSDFT